MNENQLSHRGAIKLTKFHRYLHRKLVRNKFPKVARGTGFDWTTGFDVRNKIGPIAIKNQGENDSCGGQAGSYFLEIQRRLQGIEEGTISAKSVYGPIAYPGGGTTVIDLENQICKAGGNLESLVPSMDAYGNPLTESMMTETSWQTFSTLQEALKRSGYVPFDVEVNIDVVAQTIRDWGAVIMEIDGQNGHTPGWQSPYPVPPSKDNPNGIWSHFMILIGNLPVTEDGKKYIIALQSEGVDWGMAGVQYISEDYFKSNYIIDTFTCCSDLKVNPIPTNTTPWAWAVRLFRLLRGLSYT